MSQETFWTILILMLQPYLWQIFAGIRGYVTIQDSNVWMNEWCLRHCKANRGRWDNSQANLGMNHAPGAGSIAGPVGVNIFYSIEMDIAGPVDMQSIALLPYHDCSLQGENKCLQVSVQGTIVADNSFLSFWYMLLLCWYINMVAMTYLIGSFSHI